MSDFFNGLTTDDKIPTLAWTWIFLAFLFTGWFLNRLSIAPIQLYDSSCSSATISECNIYGIRKAVEEINKNLPSRLKKLGELREAFPFFKLFPLSYRLFIADLGSEYQVKISDPFKIFSIGLADLVCDISSKKVSLPNNKYVEFSTATLTGDVQSDTGTVVNLFVGAFHGCTFLPRDQKFIPPPNTIISPTGIISFEVLMKHSLKFDVGSGVKLALFLGIFAIIGGLFASIKQFITIAKKGLLYFYEN